MSTWRRKAIDFLPEFRAQIESAESASYLWVEISAGFNEAIEATNESFIKGTLNYLAWCTSEVVCEEIQQAVYCGFLEDITENRKNWPLFRAWFNNAQFEKYKGSFIYALSEQEFTKLENTFYGR